MSKPAHPTNTINWRNIWFRPKTGVVAVISLSLLAWILWRANLGNVWKSLLLADYLMIALGIPVILFGLIFRAQRWRILLSPLGKPKFRISFNSMMVGYFANNVLPARAGELIRVYALNWQFSISKSATLATIIVERISDGLIMLVALSFLMIVLPVPYWVCQVAVIGAVVFVAIIVFLIAISDGRKRVMNVLHVLLSSLSKRLETRCISLLDNFIDGLTSFRNTKCALLFIMMTILVWSMDVLWFFLIIQAFGISLNISAVVLVVVVGSLSTMIPALPGYVGTLHFALVKLLTFLGVTINQALAVALVLHAVTWLIISVVGVLCAIQIGVISGQAYGRIAENQSIIDDL